MAVAHQSRMCQRLHTLYNSSLRIETMTFTKFKTLHILRPEELLLYFQGAGVSNPVILLDEFDEAGQSARFLIITERTSIFTNVRAYAKI